MKHTYPLYFGRYLELLLECSLNHDRTGVRKEMAVAGLLNSICTYMIELCFVVRLLKYLEKVRFLTILNLIEMP